MSSSISFHLNGETQTAPEGQTIGELVQSLPLSPKMILVEVNGEAPLRSEWPNRKIQDGDRIEIIRVVAGG